MLITIVIDGSTQPRQLERIQAAIAALQGPAATAAAHQKLFGGEVSHSSAKHHIDLEVALNTEGALAEIEALKKAVEDAKLPESVGEKLFVDVRESTPVFGQQPVPEEDTGVHFTGHGMTDRPLAASDAPSGAGAEASASAPEVKQATVPTPPSAAPSAPAPPAAAATQGPAETVDSAGLPWDERIHAGSRATIADGTWRKKRGVDPVEVTTVEAELHAEGFGLTQSTPLVVGEGILKDPAAQAPAAPTPPAAGEGLQFKQITSRVTVALANKTLTGPDLIAKLKELGVENLAALDARPDLWQAALDKLGV